VKNWGLGHYFFGNLRLLTPNGNQTGMEKDLFSLIIFGLGTTALNIAHTKCCGGCTSKIYSDLFKCQLPVV